MQNPITNPAISFAGIVEDNAYSSGSIIIALLLTNFPLVKLFLKSPLLFLPEEDKEEEPSLAGKTEGGRRFSRVVRRTEELKEGQHRMQ
jgi:ABC-type Fe3+ transport system permease subunit